MLGTGFKVQSKAQGLSCTLLSIISERDFANAVKQSFMAFREAYESLVLGISVVPWRLRPFDFAQDNAHLHCVIAESEDPLFLYWRCQIGASNLPTHLLLVQT